MAIPPPPADLNQIHFFAPIVWHQRWEVFQGVFTPGHNPVAQLCQRLQLPEDLSGLRVLDVGAWHGCFSFECERRGAAEVIALSPEDPEETGFQRLKNALRSEVRYVRGSIYDADRLDLGRFDLILFLGVLYHLRHPLLAIDQLALLCRGKVLIESHVIDDFVTLAPRQITTLCRLNKQLPALPLWLFYPGKELNSDETNWFGPNTRAVLAAFDSAGFETTLLDQWDDRAAFAATPRPHIAQ